MTPEFVYPGASRLPADCVLPIDKPAGMSSFGVVRIVRGVLSIRRVGHAGTLDPMATGLLAVLVGRGTKSSREIMGWAKEYTGVIRLGEETDSYDAETPVVRYVDAAGVSTADVRAAAEGFVGDIVQVSPAYSAVRVGGERSYKRARRGETFTRPPRIVTVDSFEVVEKKGADVSFVLNCSTGTYVRTLAHDLGQRLGVGAHLISLRRTRIGPLSVDDAWSLEELRTIDVERN